MKKLTLCFIVAFIVLNANSQITVSSLNNVGIKTTTPNEALEINGNIRGNAGGGALKINASTGYIVIGPQSVGYCHTYTDRPNFLFNQTVLSINGDFGSYYTSDLIFKTGVSYYNYSGDIRMTIKNSNGFVGIGNTNPSYLLDVNGVIRVVTTTYQSDERLKNNIKDVSGALTSLINLKGKTFNLNPPAGNTISTNLKPINTAKTDTSKLQKSPQVTDSTLFNRSHIGFLAQDVQKVFPELVYADKDGMLSVDYVSLIPVLVESIKEQQSTINELKATLEELKKKVNTK